MKLDVNLIELHKAASRTINIPTPSLEDAEKAGRDAASEGLSPENCHFMYFSTPELKDAWETGKAGQNRLTKDE